MSQQGTVTIRGVVIDKETHSPLDRVHVLSPFNNTTTNSNGEFSMVVNMYDPVTFQHVAYDQLRKPAMQLAGLGTVKMQLSNNMLEEATIMPKGKSLWPYVAVLAIGIGTLKYFQSKA